MAGSALEINGKELDRLNSRLTRYFRKVSKPAEGMRIVAGTLESQTKGRIKDEKASPEGEPWAEWSPNYEKTRHANHDKLENEGHLHDDIANDFGDNFAQAFTSLVYGRVHQEGFSPRNIPARPYLGLSADNAEEIEGLFVDWLEAQL